MFEVRDYLYFQTCQSRGIRHYDIRNLFADLSVRLVQLKGFSVYIGGGIMGGLIHEEYTDEVENLISSYTDEQTTVIGL
ncbi:MAG TPA: hypothetical protein VF679_09790, partial [Pedobacter sp.]